MRRKPRIAFISGLVSGVMHYRMWQPAEALRKLGYKVAVLWYQSNIIYQHPWELEVGVNPHIAKDVEMAYKWADVVVWMSLHTPEALQLFMKMKDRKPTISEFDDDMFNMSASHAAAAHYYPASLFASVAASQIEASKALIVSTPYLADTYSQFNSSIYVNENTIDTRLWSSRPSSSGGPGRVKRKINIGWAGGATHEADLDIVRDVILRLLNIYGEDRLKFTCLHGCPRWAKGHNQIAWTHDFRTINEYPQWVTKYRFDIGIAPLLDTHFNRCKSNLRWLEYSAMGIPTVASSVDHFEKTIEHGKTGLLVPGNDSVKWTEALCGLIDSEEERQRIGAAAYDEVLKNWSPRNQALRYIDIVEKILCQT